MWYKDLVDYFGVDESTCVKLGQPFKYDEGNKVFPSKNKSVSRQEIVDIWHSGDWDDKSQIFYNYGKIGSWLAFRQVYKHEVEARTNFARLFFDHIKPTSRILEYGCGVAPFSYYIIKNYGDLSNLKFNLCDLHSEHYTFGQYRLKKHAPLVDFNFYYSTENQVIPNIDGNFDVVCIMDVLEHLINPYDVILWIYNKMSQGAVMVETWIDDPPACSNLKSSYNERKKTMNFIQKHYKQVKKGSCRKWIKL